MIPLIQIEKDCNKQSAQYSNLSSIMNNIKKIICKFDLFNSVALLRRKGQPQHNTIMGGVISIAFIVLLIIAFQKRIVGTIQRQVILSTVNIVQQDHPSSSIISSSDGSPFMFGVEAWHINLADTERYFDVMITNTQYRFGEPIANQSVKYSLEPCRKDHWDGFPIIEGKYHNLNMNSWLCLPKSITFQLVGKYSSEISKTLDITVKKCTNNSIDSRPCASQDKIDQLFQKQKGTIFFTIYFLNPLINSESYQPVSYYLQDRNYITFSKNGGQQSRIQFQDYQINTDLSILPFEDRQTRRGLRVVDTALKSTYTQLDETYAIFYLFKSSKVANYTRSFEKLDQILAYIGGLLSIILAALFVLVSYNNHKFQINLAGSLYKDAPQKKNLLKKYNFLSFLLQSFYNLVRIIKKSSNTTPDYYYKARQSILTQLDILFLVKRINFIEKALTILMTKQQLKWIHLSNDFDMKRIKKLKRDFRVKSKMRKQVKKMKKKLESRERRPNQQYVVQNEEQSEATSSESNKSSSDEQNHEEYQQFQITNSLKQLRNKEDERSKNIWKIIDAKIKDFVQLVIRKEEIEDIDIRSLKKQRELQPMKKRLPKIQLPIQPIVNPIDPYRMDFDRRIIQDNEGQLTPDALHKKL